jgi:sugar phosphate isomerase/epimerase
VTIRNLLKKSKARAGGDIYEISIVPGTVGKITADFTPENEWTWAVESMKEIYDFAMQAGVHPSIEPINRFETYFITRGAQALALAEATGPECGVCLDTFHMNIEEKDMLETIRLCGDRLVDVHVCDSNRMASGQGHLDWERIVSTLKSVGYDGALTVEFVSPVDRTPANEYPEAVETDPVDISPEQKKFIEDHGSSLISEKFYNWLVELCADKLLPLIK